MAKNYDFTGNDWNNPLQHSNDSSWFSDGVLGAADNFLSFLGFGDSNATSQVFGELTGYNSQQREFAQQEYLLEREQEYASAPNQMKLMKQAGINPLTAAGGIAGNAASPSAPQVSNDTGGASSALGAASQAAGVIGQNALAGAQANEINSALDSNIARIQSETAANLEKAGLDHWSALSVATLLPTLQPNAMADFYMKLAQLDNVRAEYNNILAEHDEIMSNIRRNESQANLNDIQSQFEAENARFAKATTDFFIQHQYRDDAPLDVSLRNSIVTGQGNPNDIGNAIYNSSHSMARGRYDAETETAYNRMLAEARAKAETDAEYAQYYNDLRNYSELVKALIQLEYSAGSGAFGILDRIGSILFRNVDDGFVPNARVSPNGVRVPDSKGDPNN